MTEKNLNLPFYLKFAQVIIGVVAFFFILYVGTEIIVPIIFATIIAILLNPLVNFLNRKKINRIISILIALLVGLILLGGFIYFIVWQVTRFSDSFPALKDKFNILSAQVITWISDTLNIPSQNVKDWIIRLRAEGSKNTSTVIGKTLSTLSSVFVIGILLPVCTFTILYYKPLILEFFARMFSNNNQKAVSDVLVQSKKLIQSYLLGLLIESAIVATLNSVGLLIIGVKYAILLGIIGGLLNMIPYIGGMIAVALPAIMALATQSPLSALWVVILYMVVQFFDNQYITPYVVASKVKINALVSIVVVLIGSALWGVAGMFLSIPLTAIVKVICDHVDGLKPFGFLLGDEMPENQNGILKLPKPRVLKKKT